jgi:hypothetical protein
LSPMIAFDIMYCAAPPALLKLFSSSSLFITLAVV